VTLLGFDTSTNATSVALLPANGGEPIERDAEPAALLGRPGHSAELLPAIDHVLSAAGATYGDLEAIAVGVGPGTFTGLRIGVATARALAHASKIPLRPVGSLPALAHGLDAGRNRLALIDARRGELFAALYTPDGEEWAPFVTGPDALVERIATGPQGLLAAGDGSIRFREILETAGVEVPPDDSRLHLVRALNVCRLAGEASATPPETVVPLYLREPDAKPREQQ
jgi:tRNA threonylcarbamoyladenosine biosynthesis protein TsaB